VKVSTINEVDTLMSAPLDGLRLEVVGIFRNGRRRYDAISKQRLVDACLQPGVSLSGMALRHGVNANLLRKWVSVQLRHQSNGVAVGAIGGASDVFVPVVAQCDVAGAPEPPPPSLRQVRPAKAAHAMDPTASKLTVEMPNGVTLRLECSGRAVELVSAMIATLGRCDVPAGR
jgi:transposase